MKVLVLVPRYFGVGGAERYTRHFTQALIDAAGEDGVGIWSFLSGAASDQAGERCYLGHAAPRSGRAAKVRFVLRALRLGGGYDLVVASHVSVAPVARAVRALTGRPYLVLAYGIEVWGDLPHLRRMALRGAARIIAISHFTAGHIANDHGVPRARLAVIEPVVDPGLLQQAEHPPLPRAARAPRVILTVARLARIEGYKGCDTVIQAMPRVAAAVGPVEYVIVGDGDDRPRLAALAEHVGAARMVRFVGGTPEDTLARWYAGCDVFVMPARAGRWDGRWRGEGFGIVFIEAAAFGKPAVTGRGDGSAEAVRDGETGLAVEAGDVDAVAGALIRLLDDEALRDRMGAAARARVLQYFTQARMRQQIRALIEEVGRVRG